MSPLLWLQPLDQRQPFQPLASPDPFQITTCESKVRAIPWLKAQNRSSHLHPSKIFPRFSKVASRLASLLQK
ncbi:hypothetical protein BGZ47_010201, partial [Haplosporangium gracile]